MNIKKIKNIADNEKCDSCLENGVSVIREYPTDPSDLVGLCVKCSQKPICVRCETRPILDKRTNCCPPCHNSTKTKWEKRGWDISKLLENND